MRVESVVRSDSSPQPCENSFDQRDITAINRSSGWAEAAEPTIPTERLAVSCCIGVRKGFYIYRTEKMVESWVKSFGETCAVADAYQASSDCQRKAGLSTRTEVLARNDTHYLLGRDDEHYWVAITSITKKPFAYCVPLRRQCAD